MTTDRTAWRTSLTCGDESGVLIRGYELRDLVGEVSFAEAFLLLARGELPAPGEAKMLEAIFVSVIDRGIVPSSIVTRYLASSGSPIQAAVAGGVMTFGDTYGGAAQQLAIALGEFVPKVEAGAVTAAAAGDAIVASFQRDGLKVPGYGYALHDGDDPRVARLYELAAQYDVAGPYCALSLAVEAALERAKGRRLALNQDGALAAIGLDMGLDWRLIRALAFIPRTAGLAVHACEEMTREPGWRHVPQSEVVYDGPPRRPLKRAAS
ncbi:MAG: citryl-CoA lyase [Candidatus Velthaea sp.]